MFQESRDGRDGHGRLEEHDLVAPAPHRGGLPRARHAAAADPAHRAAAQARQAGVSARVAPRPPHTKDPITFDASRVSTETHRPSLSLDIGARENELVAAAAAGAVSPR